MKMLQATLAKDKAIYPEAYITGYFGSLTRDAVMRFQSRYSLPTVGIVGPLTRATLNRQIFQSALKNTPPQVLQAVAIGSAGMTANAVGNAGGGGGGSSGGSTYTPTITANPSPPPTVITPSGPTVTPPPAPPAIITPANNPPPSPNPYTPPPTTASTVCNTVLIGPDGLDSSRIVSKEACDLLNYLYSKGLASGNTGDVYENRDNLHVNLCDGWMPNPTCPAEHRLFLQHDWRFSGSVGAARGVSSGTVVGQASFSGSNDGSIKHSIPYVLYQSQSGADDLYRQYTHGNLYIYPSLYEDSFAGDGSDVNVMANPIALNRNSINIANTPYVVETKQIAKAGTDYYHIHDASGSDLPYVELALVGLASFKPDVKQRLISGTNIGGDNISFLMPTLQMLIRNAHKSVSSDTDYLSSVAHRSTVMMHYFSNGLPQPAYDPAKLARTASDLSISDIPPLVQLKIISEDFTSDEKLFTTPGSIARKTSFNQSRKITVSAADSVDIDGNKSAHIYEWRLLDSDPAKARITVSSTDQSTATIEFSSGSSIDRVDIGVFVKANGQKYYSVPGIISLYVHP